jgi:hypothetical protein
MGIQGTAPDLSGASMYGVVSAVVTIETFMAVTFPCQYSRMMAYEGKVPPINPDQLVLCLL